MKITILDAIGIPDEQLEDVPVDCEVVKVEPGRPVPAQLAVHADAWIVDARTTVEAATLDGLPRLRVISKFGAGTDNISIAAATERRVWVCNTPGVLDDAVAELTIGMLIAARRQMLRFDRCVRDGGWDGTPPTLTRQVHGATLAIVGLGGIGRRVAELARAFRMQVLYHSRRRKPEAESAGLATWSDWDDLFRRADFVSIHTPLTEQTHHLVGAREFRLMKRTAILINTSRGAVVDQAALVDALREQRIGGAALDVFDVEPLPPSDPLVHLDHTLLLPHVGSATSTTRAQMRLMALRNAIRAAQGRRPESTLNAWTESASCQESSHHPERAKR